MIFTLFLKVGFQFDDSFSVFLNIFSIYLFHECQIQIILQEQSSHRNCNAFLINLVFFSLESVRYKVAIMFTALSDLMRSGANVSSDDEIFDQNKDSPQKRGSSTRSTISRDSDKSNISR